jgi:hypothetical protein
MVLILGEKKVRYKFIRSDLNQVTDLKSLTY